MLDVGPTSKTVLSEPSPPTSGASRHEPRFASTSTGRITGDEQEADRWRREDQKTARREDFPAHEARHGDKPGRALTTADKERLKSWRDRRQQEEQENSRPNSFFRTRADIPTERIHSTAQQTKNPAWRPKGSEATVGGRSIGGMVYVGAAPIVGEYREKCRAYIDPALSVASRPADPTNPDMYYWPSYSDISPPARATYLQWLAEGRNDPSYDVGFMFLYFYGLERRFFLDDAPDDEKQEILAEVMRLVALYPENYSVQRYLEAFIDVAKIATGDDSPDRPSFVPRYGVSISLKARIGLFIKNGDPVPAEWMLSWWYCWPEKRLRTPATRCAPEFKELFQTLFTKRYPDGLPVKAPKKVLKAEYEAASREFSLSVSVTGGEQNLPDIEALTRPLKIAQEIADVAIDALDKYSRFLGRSPNGRGTLEARAFLPRALWDGAQSDEVDALKTWASEIVTAGSVVPLPDVLQKLEGEVPEKLGKRHLIGAADALATLGYGMAPDPRYGLRAPKIDDPIVLFSLPDGPAELDDVSDAYRAALLEIGLGAFVAQADGKVHASEEATLAKTVVDTAELSTSERARLQANLVWLLSVPPDLSLFRARLKQADPGQKEAIRRIVVHMANADADIRPEEVKGVERIYKTLGIDPDLVYTDLHSGRPASDPVPVHAAQTGAPGEKIPHEPVSALDAARIAAIRSDTSRVSQVLGEIFDDDDPEDDEAVADGSVFDGLYGFHTILLRALLDRDNWTEDEFRGLAEQHGLMAAGALETINEWSFDRHDDALIEDYDGYEINGEIAEKLKQTA